MEVKILHIYPDLMSLYGSYANLSVLRRYLEALGCTVTVDALRPGETPASLTDYDFLFPVSYTHLTLPTTPYV